MTEGPGPGQQQQGTAAEVAQGAESEQGGEAGAAQEAGAGAAAGAEVEQEAGTGGHQGWPETALAGR